MASFVVSAETYAKLIAKVGLDVPVDYRRKYDVELDGISSEEDLVKSLDE